MRKILSKLSKIITEKNLIENNDKIAVGISGGKDSLILLQALNEYKKFSKINFDIIAITIDLSNGDMDFEKIKEFCNDIKVEYYCKISNVFEIVFDIRKEKNPCALCSNLRRGQLNSYAKELGCNKVALGHHKDDLIETFLLSMFFEGRLSTFKPLTYLSRIDMSVIRPLLYVEEDEIVALSQNLPTVKNTCKHDKNSQREKAKIILNQLENTYPNSKQKIFNAITNPNQINLW